LEGDQATKANLNQVDSPYILHIASHAMFLGPEESAAWHLSTAPDADSGGDDALGAGQGFLALAGANITVKSWQNETTHENRANDGMLSGEEVGGLRLQGTWLVTLSACDTGCGEALAGEGVLGLRRGFTEAGAQNLLLTLWPISDSETADLMKVFYQQALTNHNAPASLAQVQRDALVSLRQREGLTAAVWKAGPFILSY
jgi:CHAT domain-containing protein